MIYISISILIVGIILICLAFIEKKNIAQKNEYILEYNTQLELINKELKQQKEDLKTINLSLEIEKQTLDTNISVKKEQLNELQSTITSSTKAKEELSQKAFENYCEVLEKQYEDYELEYNQHNAILEEAYARRQLELIHEMEQTQKDLDQIKATRVAAIQAQTREKEIEEKLSFYCLTIPETEIKDIGVLEAVAPKLNKPRVLYMLIWQTFFRTPMTTLCNQVIGTSTKSGIYKITNIKTKECYIGQAVDLASRWKDHAKFGLRIDTPAGNKLYKAMQEYGIWNFSWEVLEEVPPALLNEKEAYYIELYDSVNFGYNSIKAPTKGK